MSQNVDNISRVLVMSIRIMFFLQENIALGLVNIKEFDLSSGSIVSL